MVKAKDRLGGGAMSRRLATRSLSCCSSFPGAPSLALSRVTFVSGKGTDSGARTPAANPCRTFQFALDQTIAGGEIKALDPAGYGGVIIAKSISITGIEGAGINRPSGDHITINAGANDVVNLSHLTLDGVKAANNGILLNSGGSLTISHCTVRNFTFAGIQLHPAGTTAFLIADTVVSNNGVGIRVEAQGAGAAKGTLDHVSAHKNTSDGIIVSANATVLAVDSTAANNSNSGFSVTSPAVLRLAHSAATGNGVGVEGTGATESAGNNFIRGNVVNVDVTLTNVGTD